MRRQCLRIVIALIAVAGFSIGVKAQVLDQIEATYLTSLQLPARHFRQAHIE